MAQSLTESKTHQNLIDAFAGESQAKRRYLYFAQQADVEGLPEIAGNFKETADGETRHAHGNLKYLAAVGDSPPGFPSATPKRISRPRSRATPTNTTRAHPSMAMSAREEGFDDIAEWFETRAKAEKSHTGRFQKMLETLKWNRPSKRGAVRTAEPKLVMTDCPLSALRVREEAQSTPLHPLEAMARGYGIEPGEFE